MDNGIRFWLGQIAGNCLKWAEEEENNRIKERLQWLAYLADNLENDDAWERIAALSRIERSSNSIQ